MASRRAGVRADGDRALTRQRLATPSAPPRKIVITLDSYELDCIILRGLYPHANKFQIARGARWRATAFVGANAATYETDPERYRIDLETEMFGEPLPSHEHLVNEHSVVKFNGGNTVFLCGYANGECRIIVCHADWDEVTERWVPGRPYN